MTYIHPTINTRSSKYPIVFTQRIVVGSIRENQRVLRFPADPEGLSGVEGGAVAVAVGERGREGDARVGRDEDAAFAAVVGEGVHRS